MAALLTNERFAGQADGTGVTTATLTNWDTSSGSGTLTQHYNNYIYPGCSAMVSLAETASRYAVLQSASSAARGVSWIGWMFQPPAVNAFVAELRATTTAVAAQVRLDTNGAYQMRNGTSAVGTAIPAPVGLHRIDWFVDSGATTQTITVYDYNQIASTDTARAHGTSSATYTTGTIDFNRIGNIGAVAGGMYYAWSAVNIDNAALPAPTFFLPSPSRPRTFVMA